MRVLLSTIGSRGDVQLVLALALQLKDLHQEVRICGGSNPKKIPVQYDLI